MELDRIKLDKEEIELHSQKEIHKQQKLVGKIVPFKGHTLFEINCTTGEIKVCDYEIQTIDYLNAKEGNLKPKRKVIVKSNCLYVSTLNKDNARKKYIKYLMFNAKLQTKI